MLGFQDLERRKGLDDTDDEEKDIPTEAFEEGI
jgi:hypothetical protein